jgi:3-oxoadipate enol-lactonase
MSTPASAQQWEERIVTAREKGMEALVDSTMSRWFPPDILAAKPAYLDRVRQMIRSTPPAGFIGCAAALADHDYRSQVRSVKVPVLFVCGEKDAPVAVMRQMHQDLSGSRYVELQGAGHISNLDRADEFNRAVRDFLT